MVPSFHHPVHNRPVFLGKKAPRRDDRTLKLAKYLKGVADPPASASYDAMVKSWPMFLNDNLGCCVIAEHGHAVEQWTRYAGVEKTVADSDILHAYEAVGGYVPGDASTDQGCDMLTALKYFRSTGLAGNKIVAFVAVDPANDREVKLAIELFGNVDLGIALPTTAQSQIGKVWEVLPDQMNGDGAPGSWGGHCIPGVQYDEHSIQIVTWGMIQEVTWNFLHVYADEAFAVLSQEWIDTNTKLAPSGFDLATLRADLAQIIA